MLKSTGNNYSTGTDAGMVPGNNNSYYCRAVDVNWQEIKGRFQFCQSVWMWDNMFFI